MRFASTRCDQHISHVAITCSVTAAARSRRIADRVLSRFIVIFVLVGLALSALLVRETHDHAAFESVQQRRTASESDRSNPSDPSDVFWRTLLGIGTAMVYPTLLAAIGEVALPTWRASAIGVYRLWQDLGYAIGAVVVSRMNETRSSSPV